MPSFTFVKVKHICFERRLNRYADNNLVKPNINADKIEDFITSPTKAIEQVPFAGMPCDMDKAMATATKHIFFVIKVAAQAINSYYTEDNGKKTPFGTTGHMAVF